MRVFVADDFGWTDEINSAIRESFEGDLITHASMIATMQAFAEACAIARRLEVGERIGVHLVLSEGSPLTDRIKSCRRICDSDGQFRRRRPLLFLRRSERDAVSAELRAQVERVRAAGFPVSHLDSHHHIHHEPAIAPIVLRLAQELGVPRVRLSSNARRHGYVRPFLKAAINARIRRAGLAGTRCVGSADDLLAVAETGVLIDNFEIVLHPVLREGQLRDAYGGEEPLQSIVRRVRAAYGDGDTDARTVSVGD